MSNLTASLFSFPIWYVCVVPSQIRIYTSKWKLVCPACEQISDRVDLKLKKELQFACRRTRAAEFSNAYASYDSSPTEKAVH